MPLALSTAASPITIRPTNPPTRVESFAKHHRVDFGSSIPDWRLPDPEYETRLQHLLLAAESTQHATMSEATLKPEKDFSKEVDQQLPEAESLAKV